MVLLGTVCALVLILTHNDCKAPWDRSVRVPRIHPQHVPLNSQREGLWETL